MGCLKLRVKLVAFDSGLELLYNSFEVIVALGHGFTEPQQIVNSQVVLVQHRLKQIAGALRNKSVILFSVKEKVMLTANLVHNLPDHAAVNIVDGKPNNADLLHAKRLRSFKTVFAVSHEVFSVRDDGHDEAPTVNTLPQSFKLS